jgi:hypothetical protein
VATIDPIIEARIWIESQLAASAAVAAAVGDRFYEHPAPRNVAYPLITHQFQASPQSVMLVGTAILWWNLRFIIRAITDTNNADALSPAVIAIFDALHGTAGPTINAQIVSCTQQRGFYMTEVDASNEYIHSGGEYLIEICPR